MYVFPASWAWNGRVGWLADLGFYDFAGACVVHMSGGASAIVAAAMLGPRTRRFDEPVIRFDQINQINRSINSMDQINKSIELLGLIRALIASNNTDGHVHALVGVARLQLRLDVRHH